MQYLKCIIAVVVILTHFQRVSIVCFNDALICLNDTNNNNDGTETPIMKFQ